MATKIKVTFLGTSAQIPTMKRNHSAIFLNYKEENILIDCGEGTQRQFRIAKLNPGKITRILITHKHLDHILGLPGLLSTLNFSEYKKTLYIYGPKGIKKTLEDFLDASGFKRTYKIIIKEVSGKFLETEEFYIEAEKMEHGPNTNAYNFVIKDKLRIDKKKLQKAKISGPILKNLKEGKDITHEGKKYLAKKFLYGEKGKKISVVLDTLYNEKIATFVKNADLLICESTFSSKNNKEAKEHKHLTAEQDGKIAKKAKVKKLILTHTSQRYAMKLKTLLKEAKENFKNTTIAEDFDEIEI